MKRTKISKIRNTIYHITNGLFKILASLVLLSFCYDIIFKIGWINRFEVKELIIMCTLILVGLLHKD